MITLLTVWVKGDGYPNDSFVKKIQTGLSDNISLPHRHICLTNEKLDFSETIALDDNNKDLVRGYWAKLQMFRNITQLNGPCLYFDLDMVIVDNIDIMIENLLEDQSDTEIYGIKSQYIKGSRDGQHDIKNWFNSSIMFWKKNPTHLWKKFSKNPNLKFWYRTYKTSQTHGDQAYIANNCKFDFVDNFCPPNFISRVKKYREKETSILFFAGKEKPQNCKHEILNKWSKL